MLSVVAMHGKQFVLDNDDVYAKKYSITKLTRVAQRGCPERLNRCTPY